MGSQGVNPMWHSVGPYDSLNWKSTLLFVSHVCRGAHNERLTSHGSIGSQAAVIPIFTVVAFSLLRDSPWMPAPYPWKHTHDCHGRVRTVHGCLLFQQPAAPVVAAKPSVPPRNMVPVAPAPAQPAPTGVGSSGQKVKLTFTGPPNTQRAAPTVKPDYSHSNYEVNKINSDNVKLCNRLVEISRAPPNPAYNNALSVGSAVVTGKLAPANVAAATVNRHRKEDKIAQENLALYKRLQAVKPSPSVNRDVLNKEFVKTQAYGENARKVKAPSTQNTSISGAAAGANATKLASSGATRQPPPGSAEEVYSRPSGSGSAGNGSRGAPDGRISNGGAAAADLSTVMEGPEGEVSDGVYAAAAAAEPNLEPEYSMDPEFDQAPSQSFAA
ncbi:hypothetical protein Vafri_21070 [Volvox africanus]|uniref:Uncharacterized protein n=1 Tax=Volvox africanus TaxID=51714 RepID=A0A8J4BS38_9CHLO|nr:hypothetical protein Vafri_21070 [Volvox africanus]